GRAGEHVEATGRRLDETAPLDALRCTAHQEVAAGVVDHEPAVEPELAGWDRDHPGRGRPDHHRARTPRDRRAVAPDRDGERSIARAWVGAELPRRRAARPGEH